MPRGKEAIIITGFLLTLTTFKYYTWYSVYDGVRKRKQTEQLKREEAAQNKHEREHLEMLKKVHLKQSDKPDAMPSPPSELAHKPNEPTDP